MLLKFEVRVLSYSFSIEGTKKRKVFEIADDRSRSRKKNDVSGRCENVLLIDNSYILSKETKLEK